MSKKICFILQNLNVGGAQKIFIHLINDLAKKNYQIILIVISSENNVLFNKLPQNIKIIYLNKRKVIYSIFSLFINLKSIKPNSIITTITNVNLALCLIRPFLRFKTKLIIREANILSENSRYDYYFIKYILVRLFYSFADSIICISNNVKKDLIDNYKIKKNFIKVIYNPIDTKSIDINLNDDLHMKKVEDVLKKLNFDKKIILISIGKLSYQKGFDILIDSMNYIKNINVCLLILCVGDKISHNKIIKKNKLEERVYLIDYDINPYQWMFRSNMYISSSRYEGLGNAVQEALYIGLPIISTPCHGGTHEILKNLNNCSVTSDFNAKTLAFEINKKLLDKKNINNKYNYNLNKYYMENISKKYEYIL